MGAGTGVAARAGEGGGGGGGGASPGAAANLLERFHTLGGRPAAGEVQDLAHHAFDVTGVGLDLEDPHLARVILVDVDAVHQIQELVYVLGSAGELELVAVLQREDVEIIREHRLERILHLAGRHVLDLQIDDHVIHARRIRFLESAARGVGLADGDSLSHLAERHDLNVMLGFHEAIALHVHQQVQFVERFLFRELAVAAVRQLAADDQVVKAQQRLAQAIREDADNVPPRHLLEIEPLHVVRRAARARGGSPLLLVVGLERAGPRFVYGRRGGRIRRSEEVVFLSIGRLFAHGGGGGAGLLREARARDSVRPVPATRQAFAPAAFWTARPGLRAPFDLAPRRAAADGMLRTHLHELAQFFLGFRVQRLTGRWFGGAA